MFVHFISINHCLHVHLVVFLICDVYYEQWFTLFFLNIKVTS